MIKRFSKKRSLKSSLAHLNEKTDMSYDSDDVADSLRGLDSKTEDEDDLPYELTFSEKVKEKLIAIITDERLQKASSLSTRLLSIVSQVALAKNNPMALLSAAGSVIGIITDSYGLNNLSEWDKWMLRHPMKGFRSNIPQLMYRSGLLDKVPLKKFIQNGDNNYLMGLEFPDGSMFTMLMTADGRATDHGWASPKLLQPGALGQVYSYMISKAFAGAHVELGVSNGEERGSLVLREYVHDLSVPYLGKHAPEKFADEVEYFRRRGIQHSVILHGPGGTGKCLGKNTPVLMYDGTIKLVQNVKNGDLLMGPDGNPRTVQGVTQGHGQLYKVHPSSGGEPFVCNDAHVLSLKDRRSKKIPGTRLKARVGDAKSAPTINIPIKDFLLKSNDFKNNHLLWRATIEYSHKSLEVDPYILGLWLGDGNSDRASLTSADETLSAVWSSWVESNGDVIKVYEQKENKSSIFAAQTGSSSSVRSNAVLRKIGVMGSGIEKHIPHIYLTASVQQRLQLLAGLIDSDGWLSRRDNYFEITQKNQKLATDICYLARSLGFKVAQASVDKNCQTGAIGTYQRITIGGNLIAVPTKLIRKQVTVMHQNKDPSLSGFQIEDIGEGDYYGFTLDEDHLFLLGDFTVTHNTTYIMSYAELTKQRVFLVGPAAFEHMSAGELEGLVDAIRPDILMLDDFDKSRRNNIVYTTLPALGTKYPKMVIVITCNRPENLDVAILRPGRGGDLVEFGVPDKQDKMTLLEQYMIHYKVDPKTFDIPALVGKMDALYTHDWVRHIAKRAIDYSTQERLMGFIALTNKKIKLVARNMSEYDTQPDGEPELL